MPNLLPDWLPWIRPAGRLIWSSGMTIVGLAFVVALIKPPLLKRPFPTRVGVALFPAIAVGGLLLAKFVEPAQRTIVWLTLGALVAHGLLMVTSRAARDPERQTTWAEAFAGAVGVFALLTVAYAIVPHEWLTFANSYLEWGDTSQFLFKSNQDMLFFPWNWPFNFDYPALRDIVVTLIYAVFLGGNLKLWVMWQHRNDVKAAEAAAEAPPTLRSRFGRPLRRARATAGTATGGA
jgi:hypothetical protein